VTGEISRNKIRASEIVFVYNYGKRKNNKKAKGYIPGIEGEGEGSKGQNKKE